MAEMIGIFIEIIVEALKNIKLPRLARIFLFSVFYVVPMIIVLFIIFLRYQE